jgi:SAM-dependent methyltransferase
LSKEKTTFLDLGCGNGSLLLALREAGWKGQCLGVDYSPQSVALAKQIAAAEEEGQSDDDEEGGNAVPLEFQEWDIIAGDYAPVLKPTPADGGAGESQGWDVVLDKGTFDAISLSSEVDTQGRRLFESYHERVLPLVKPGTGLFILTSCNWTEEELRSWFVTTSEQGDGFEVASRVEYKSFSFGGVKGQTISTLCFRRRG